MKFLKIGILMGVFATIIMSGCVSTGTTTKVTEGQGSPTIDQAQAEYYNGPKARIAVAQFKDKTGGGWWTGRIGDGMADQMVTSLFNTNRFIVLERQTLNDVMTEQDLGASGRIRKDTAAPIGEIEGAELMVVGAVTEFEGGNSGMQGGLGGIGHGVLGGLTGGFRKSHMAIDVRIVDTRTSRIVAATSVEGEATDVNMGGLVGGWGGSGALAAGLGGWQNTPIEKALRMCIKQAVEFIVSKTPQNYYHYGQGGAPAGGYSSPAAGSSSYASKSEIMQMQAILNKLGYNVGTPDGNPGKKTIAALSDFQQKNGLPVSGSFDTATIQRLRQVGGQ